MNANPPVRVLQVCTILLTARVFVGPVARYLARCGYEVAISCSIDDEPDGPVATNGGTLDGFRLFHVGIPRTIRPIKDLLAVWQMYLIIRQMKPTIVHTQTSKAGMVGRVAARLAGTPIIVHTAHAFPFHAYLPAVLRWLYVRLERWAAGLCDLIIVDTESVRTDGLRAHIVSDSEKLVVVPMGLDVKRFSPSSERASAMRRELGYRADDRIVGAVARLVPDKGIDCFVRMAARIHAVLPDVRFLIVGDGPLRVELEQMAVASGLKESIRFVGHRTDVPDLIRCMDVFALPTRREGFGLVFAEAMALSVPVVGSRIGPVAEVVEDGVTGYLASPDAPEEFAGLVLSLLGDEAKRREFGQAGRRRVERHYDETTMCKRIEWQYRRLLGQKAILR